MAINVDTVYKTVLLILNKEQRGYITPDEFNKTATQVQLDIFEQYFDDLNQQLRVPQADYDYADRQMNIDEKISYFKVQGQCGLSTTGNFFVLPESATGNVTFAMKYANEPLGKDEAYFYRLGTITYIPLTGYPVELQRLQRSDFYNIDKSPLTRPTEEYPCYLYEGNRLYIKPTALLNTSTSIEASMIRKPLDVNWAFQTNGPGGSYIWDSSTSQNFELEQSEQVNVILRILQYSGIVIRDPQVIQAASAEVAQNEANKKS
ncbi:MAG: hypothetical protein GY787_16680 [Alteromonadales bacterium]|nr:hypothetical protein [Alteromonadales bacterium]